MWRLPVPQPFVFTAAIIVLTNYIVCTYFSPQPPTAIRPEEEGGDRSKDNSSIYGYKHSTDVMVGGMCYVAGAVRAREYKKRPRNVLGAANGTTTLLAGLHQCEHTEPSLAAKMSQKQNHLAGEGNTNLVLPANA